MEKLLLDDLQGMTDEELVGCITRKFQIERSELDGVDILIGSMEDGGYDGSAYFLVRNRETGALYEVTGGHCSCYGFEGQWSPAITSKEYLLSQNYRWRDHESIKQFVTELFS